MTVLLLVAILRVSALEGGQAAFRVRNWPAAERHFAQALREQPGSGAAQKWLGITYAAQGKFTLAEGPLRRACQLDSSDSDSCYSWGRILYTLGRWEHALAAYEKALKAALQPGRIFLGLALSHEKLHHPSEAELYYRRAVEAGERQAAIEYQRFRRRAGSGEQK
ncbi:MAG: tetratricopeptide repeat protein [Bryobacterales bacterium]|nr:tetratricopeptide repeat protein [Bryobacterales bacterium]